MVTLFDPLPVKFYVGLDHPHMACHFSQAFISVNALRRRKGSFPARRWILDSGAFTELSRHGRYRSTVSEYAIEARRWCQTGTLELIVSQDYMCEPFILKKTGMTVDQHQALTIQRYDELVAENLPVPIMPVLQGYEPAEYVRHLAMYGDRLKHGMRVGVGSVCKRNGDPAAIIAVLQPLKKLRPDLRFHGFGIKKTALASPIVRRLLYSADSMAWSYAARKQGRDNHDWGEAKIYERAVLKLINS